MKMISRSIAGLGLVAAFAGVGQAQYLTDAGSPLGSGAGTSGSVVSYVAGVSAASVTYAARYISAVGSGVSAPLNAVSQALSGNPGALNTILAGVSGGGALAQALAALGSNPSPAAAVDAIRAFNTAVDGGALSGSEASVALRGVELALMTLGAKPVT